MTAVMTYKKAFVVSQVSDMHLCLLFMAGYNFLLSSPCKQPQTFFSSFFKLIYTFNLTLSFCDNLNGDDFFHF